MIFRNLDSGGDWVFGNGKGNYKSENQAIILNIRTRIYSWFGDCFFDTQAGIDWLNRLGSRNQRELLEADLRRIITQTDGVTGILDLSTDLTNRGFSAQYEITTIYSRSYVDLIEVLT